MEEKEAQEVLELHRRELQEEVSYLQSMMESAGWKQILKYAENQVKNRMPGVLKRLDNLLEVGLQEFEKGEISGIQLFQAIPGLVIESHRQELKILEEELGEIKDDEQRDDGGNGGNGGRDFEPAI